MASLLRHALVAFTLAASGFADSGPGVSPPETCQVAVLSNGFTVEYARRDAVGSVTRLWMCSSAGGGYLELPSNQIARFEPGQSPARPVPPAPPAVSPRPEPDPQPPRDPVRNLIDRVAQRHQIDPDFVASVVKAESGFLPGAVSPKGAAGLMQLMPGTAAGLGVRDVFDPAANLEAGTKYLRELLDRYSGDALKALAAFNAGPQRVAQFGGVPPYPETRAYIVRVIDDYNRKKIEQQKRSTAPPARPLE